MAATHTLTPAKLDDAALRTAPRLVEPADVTRQFEDLVADFHRTAPADPAARLAVTKTVAELVAEAGIEQPQEEDPGTRPPFDIKLPGLLCRALPDFLHLAHSTNITYGPSVQLYVAAEILRKWGHQKQRHKLRDLRGRRCVCGAIIAAVNLGVGMPERAEESAGYVLNELRRRRWVHERGWPRLIGDWSQMPERTVEQAIDVTRAAARTAARRENGPK